MPLTLFLLLVAGVLAFASHQRWSTPAFDDAVRMLADGDLDGPERPRVLRVVVDGAAVGADPTASWFGMLAAVALDDRTAFERVRALLGPGPAPAVLPAHADRSLLHLGDPVLGNLAEAMSVEAAGDAVGARRSWLRVRAECRLAPRPLAAALADEALARLPK